MSAIAWMEANVPRFPELTKAERDAAMHFSLLWSYFEGEYLSTRASAGAIVKWVHELEQQGRLRPDVFTGALEYFRGRYVSNGEFTPNFYDLNLRGDKDHRPLVEALLQRDDPDPENAVAVVFIIIYRFRNNFFHGLKWGDFLRGQRENFEIASEVLMRGMKL